jgi:hypothetical protein
MPAIMTGATTAAEGREATIPPIFAGGAMNATTIAVSIERTTMIGTKSEGMRHGLFPFADAKMQHM